ncbi:MAG TPA: twin-arginine translocase subunit TatC [Streptosporangiaceae bacterium]|nr:twin-arginine translocase subunit TatC [Streptosporangiaceae bacterium]
MPLSWPGSGTAAGATGRRANPDGRMPLIEHIRELRSRMVKILLALTVGSIFGWIFFGPVWKFIERPYCKIQINHRPTGAVLGSGQCTLFVTGIFDSFFLHLKIAILVGIIVSSPVWLYQVWAFVAPGLYRRERRWTYLFVGSAVPLFALGGAFAYLAMTRGLRFLLGLVPNGAQPIITINTYLGYAMAMLLIFGVAFEVPLTLVILNLAGVLTHERFRKWRRMMIFGVFAFAAVATPSPDPITMLLLAVPCVVLVELAEVAIWANDRRRARRPSPYDGLSPDEASPLDQAGGNEPASADRR